MGRGIMPAEPEGVDRTGTGADVAQPVADRLGGNRLGLTRRLDRVVPEGEMSRQHRRVRAARAVRRPARVALAGKLRDRVAVEHDIGRLLAVTTRDHDHRRAQRMDGPGQLGGARVGGDAG